MNIIGWTIKIVNDCLTGIDGETYDPARVYLSVAVLVFLAATVIDALHGIKFEAQSFGIGFGALLAGGGLGVSLKSHTEPDKS